MWKKISRLARQKKNILTLVLSEKKILNETKNHIFKLNGRSLTCGNFINNQDETLKFEVLLLIQQQE